MICSRHGCEMRESPNFPSAVFCPVCVEEERRPLPSAAFEGSIALLPDGRIDRGALIVACRNAGFDNRQWQAMTFERGPYDVTYPTVQLENLVRILTGREVKID